MTPSDEEVRVAIAEQAGEWFIAQQAGPLDAEESAAFLAWLKASPIHVREYLGVARIAHHLPAAVRRPHVPLETFLAQQAQQGMSEDSIVALESPVPRRERSQTRRIAPWVLP